MAALRSERIIRLNSFNNVFEVNVFKVDLSCSCNCPSPKLVKNLNSCNFVFAASVQCITSTFGKKTGRMLRCFARFGKRCCSYLQGFN